jgi:hypothetical protein
MSLRVQYQTAYFEAPSNLFVVDDGKFVVVSRNTCTASTTGYSCNEITFSKKGTGYFDLNSIIAQINLTAKANTAANTASKISIALPTGVYAAGSESKYSHLQNPNDAAKADFFGASPSAESLIYVEDYCLGNYNRKNGIGGAIVDLADFSKFAELFGEDLEGVNFWYDIVNTPNPSILEGSDLSLFASNYGKTTCVKTKSQL